MELTRINELMADRGYCNPIGAIFPNWEFVKDEILLPNRKSGSGNGTIHIYLMEENTPMFRRCFPEYVKSFANNEPNIDSKCPKIKHFVLTSNILTVAGFAYHYYGCDSNRFNYAAYSRNVMKNDYDGMLTFESLFKFSTENRPYFKQFDKQIFSHIIRYLFVPKQTAYKLYLYSDYERKNYAVFWIIGQIADKTFIVDEDYKGKFSNTPEPVEEIPHEKCVIEQELPITESAEDVKARFIQYMASQGKSERTIKAYASNLTLLISRAQKMMDGQEHPSLYTITDLEQLRKLEKELFSNQEVSEWNSKGHYRASSSLHAYICMLEGGNSSEMSSNKQKGEENVQKPDFTLTLEEEKQRELFIQYLKEEKKLPDDKCANYAKLLQKKMSVLIRDYYKSNFRNVFAINDYKVLLDIEDELKKTPETNGKMLRSFNLYMDFVSNSIPNDELGKMVFSNGDESEDESKFKVCDKVGKLQQYTSYLPIYSLSAACGRFAEEREVEMEGWVNIENKGIKVSSDMFVVHAKGNSMEPKIKDGDYCIFKQYQGGSRNGSIVLTQLTTHDSDYGGMYTIKKYYSEKVRNEYGVMQHSKIELRSLNPEYENIEVKEEDADDMKTIGIFVDTLN